MNAPVSGTDAVDGFRRRGEDELFAAHVFTLSEVHLADPDGEPFDRHVIRHPGAVAVVPVHDDGTVTLVRQMRPAVWRSLLEAPAGTRDVDGEPPEETARRELAEEAGLVADRVELLGRVYNSPGVSDQLTLIYLATSLSACDTGREGVEERFMVTESVRLDEVLSLVATGRLLDETTILGLLLAREALHRGH